MKDVCEKYILISRDFPDKAGKLRQVLETQKRLITALSRSKQPENVKELLVSVAEGYDISLDLLEWMKLVLRGVANDADTLVDGAKMRNILKMQSTEIGMLWDEVEKFYESKRSNKQAVKN